VRDFVLALLMSVIVATPTLPPPRLIAPKTEAQRVALCALEPEVCYSGRKFGGKSWVACTKGYIYASVYPGARVLICREERASMEGTTLPVLWEVVPSEVKAAYWRESKSALILPNASEIHIDGLDKPQRIQGSRYGFAACDQAEDLDYNQFTILNGCIGQHTVPWRQLLLAFNPASPHHWAYKRYQPDLGDGVRTDDEGIMSRVIHVQHDDLMDIIAPDYKKRLERMTGTWYKRWRLGLWCAFEGLVYPMWSPASMVVQRPVAWQRWGGYPPPDWPRVRGIDFGVVHPFVCQWWAFDPEGVGYCYREIYMTNRSISAHAKTIKDEELRELEALRAACTPHEARALSSYLGRLYLEASYSDHDRSDRLTLEEHGVWTQPADKEVLAGIDTLGTVMAEGRMKLVAGRMVEIDEIQRAFEEPTCFEEELAGYHWPTNQDGVVLKREVPVAVRDHACDVARYVFNTRRRATQVRVFA
jgi:phage terminase large subunit